MSGSIQPTPRGPVPPSPSNPPEPSSLRARRVTWVILSLVGIVLFVAVIYLAGVDRVGAILDAKLEWVAAAFAAGLAVTITSTFRWGYIANSLADGRPLSWAQYWASLLTSRVLGLFVPRNASDLGVRFAALTGLGRTSPEVAAASVALDQMFDIALLVVWLVPSLLLLSGVGGVWTWLLVPMTAVLAPAIMVKLGEALRWVARILSRAAARLGERRGRIGEFFQRRSEGLRRLANVQHFTRRQSLAIAAVTFVRYVLNAVMFWSVAQALGLSIDLWTFILVGSAVQLSLVVAFTPGGLGIMDLGFVGLLALGGVASETVAAFIVGQRAFQYTFFPLMAGVSYVATMTRGSSPADSGSLRSPGGEA